VPLLLLMMATTEADPTPTGQQGSGTSVQSSAEITFTHHVGHLCSTYVNVPLAKSRCNSVQFRSGKQGAMHAGHVPQSATPEATMATWRASCGPRGRQHAPAHVVVLDSCSSRPSGASKTLLCSTGSVTLALELIHRDA
jgi:hypothetical protein